MAKKPKNAFQLDIPEIRKILQDFELQDVIQDMRRDVFLHLGVPGEEMDALSETLMSAAKHRNVTEYEKAAHEILEKAGVISIVPEKLAERAKIICGQIKDYLLQGSVLDLGCGDGLLAQRLKQEGFKPQLADVYENPNVAGTGLPFQLLGQNKSIPFSRDQFDNTLLLTVLHHSDNPVGLIQEAKRVTRPGGKVIVIESVYGVDSSDLKSSDRRPAVEKYLALDAERQRLVNIFFDHFYNRVIHYSEDEANKVNVPFNFNTPGAWKVICENNGLQQERVIHLGVDQMVVPEYHTLHILRAS